MSKQPVANRLFSCVACRTLLVICSACDRDNIYCASCAPEIRRQRRREAGARYQGTLRGKHMHAARQQRYRERLKAQKVTHTGSKDACKRVLLTRARRDDQAASAPDMGFSCGAYRCHFCGKSPTRFLRRERLQHSAYPGKQQLRVTQTKLQ